MMMMMWFLLMAGRRIGGTIVSEGGRESGLKYSTTPLYTKCCDSEGGSFDRESVPQFPVVWSRIPCGLVTWLICHRTLLKT